MEAVADAVALTEMGYVSDFWQHTDLTLLNIALSSSLNICPAMIYMTKFIA